MNDSGTGRHYLIALCVVTAFGSWLRMVDIDQSLWLDELHTSWVVAGEWKQVGERTALGNQPIGYFAALRLVVGPDSQTEFRLRLPSVICGTLLIFSTLLPHGD